MRKISIFTSTLFTVYCLLLTASFAQQNLPSVEIISPVSDAVYPDGSELTLTYRTEGFTFVDYKNNREPFPGNPNAGHAHFWVVPADFEGEPAHDDAKKLLQDFRPEKFSVNEPGEYKVIIELTQNNHAPYDPPVRAETIFKVGDISVASETFEALQRSIPLYKFSAVGLLGLLVLYAGFKTYKKFVYKKKIETANEGLPKSDPGGQKTQDTSTTSQIEGKDKNNNSEES